MRPARVVRGYFKGETRRPFVRAQVRLPRLQVAAEFPLVVDTGADTTTIHWPDRRNLRTLSGRRLAADAAFRERVETTGIAGARVQYGLEDAVLVFRSEDGARVRTIVRVQVELVPPVVGVASLLGRDVLGEARLDFNMPADTLALEWAR